jgi:cytoskeletal protein CcmA (bactofilin family)
MAQNDTGYEFYVGPATHLEGASLAIDGTARIDGKIVGKVAVKHLIVGPSGCVVGDISGETAEVEGTVEDSLQLSGKLTVCSSGRIRGNIKYGSIECMEGAKLVGEISTDWEGAVSEAPVISDRLEAFTATVSGDSLDAGAADDEDKGL